MHRIGEFRFTASEHEAWARRTPIHVIQHRLNLLPRPLRAGRRSSTTLRFSRSSRPRENERAAVDIVTRPSASSTQITPPA